MWNLFTILYFFQFKELCSSFFKIFNLSLLSSREICSSILSKFLFIIWNLLIFKCFFQLEKLGCVISQNFLLSVLKLSTYVISSKFEDVRVHFSKFLPLLWNLSILGRFFSYYSFIFQNFYHLYQMYPLLEVSCQLEQLCFFFSKIFSSYLELTHFQIFPVLSFVIRTFTLVKTFHSCSITLLFYTNKIRDSLQLTWNVQQQRIPSCLQFHPNVDINTFINNFRVLF